MNKNELTIKNMKDGRYELHCPICKISIVPEMPMPIDEFLAFLNKFEREHNHKEPS
jgi:hypothetical protein